MMKAKVAESETWVLLFRRRRRRRRQKFLGLALLLSAVDPPNFAQS